MTENEHFVSDIIELSQPQVSQSLSSSHLPSWVLKMRMKIRESRIAHAETQNRINNLTDTMESLSLKIVALKPINLTSNEILSDTVEQKIEKAKFGSTSFLTLNSLPTDALNLVLSYLTVSEVAAIESLNTLIRVAILECIYWTSIFQQYFPFFKISCELNNHMIRNAMIIYLNGVKSSVTFLTKMKDQRCIPKHRSIQPHRHSKLERTITHPLPVFDSQARRITNAIGNDVRNVENEMIMSRSETLSSDFRTVAHRALATIYHITSNVYDVLHYKLVSEGCITVLISLLSNEEGALQNYSCGILANLLCWESRLNDHSHEEGIYSNPLLNDVFYSRRTTPDSIVRSPWIRNIQKLHSSNYIDYETVMLNNILLGTTPNSQPNVKVSPFLNNPNYEYIPLRDQIFACNGHRMLTSLLTSPSASINLAGKAKSTGGFNELRMTASVQGISTKQASRALVALFSNNLSIPAVGLSDVNKNISKIIGVDSFLNNRQTSGSVLDRNPSVHNLSSHVTKSTKKQNNSIEVKHQDESQPEQNISDKNESSSESWNEIYDSPWTGSNVFISDNKARPWVFTYFHKSGSLKDRFRLYMQLTPDGFLRGRGKDSIGVFTMNGKADKDIVGWTWYFHKTYVKQKSHEENDAEMTQWLTMTEEDPSNTWDGSNGGGRVHVSHLGYWSNGEECISNSCRRGNVYNTLSEDNELEQLLTTTEETLGIWGIGMWGVWETCSSVPHFELDKGGVFRASPLL